MQVCLFPLSHRFVQHGTVSSSSQSPDAVLNEVVQLWANNSTVQVLTELLRLKKYAVL